jgi:hypothetical protein
MTLLQRLRAKQKADEEKRQARLARRRETALAEREHVLADGLNDLPVDVAVDIENAVPAEPTPAKLDKAADYSVENLVSRLAAIRERIWRLQATFAVSLSQEIALEANRYLRLFQELAEQLKAKDASALDDLVRGHESLLLSPSVLVKQTIPLDVQRLCEIRWEVSQAPVRRVPTRPADEIHDGLGWML